MVKAILNHNLKFGFMEMYKNITSEQLMELMNRPNLKWVLKSKTDTMNPELEWLLASYSPQNALTGLTDYKDHRKDSLEDLKKLTMESVEKRNLQLGNYYNTNEEPFDTVIVSGSYGGWSAYCAWSNGGDCFFAEERERSRQKYSKRFKNKK